MGVVLLINSTKMKFSITIITFLFLINISYSQKISLGPEVGLNIIPIENTELGHHHHLGYHLGASLSYNFSDKFKLSTGLFLSQKKQGYSSSNTKSVSTLLDEFLNIGGGFISLPDTSGLDSLFNIPGLNTDMTETINGVTSELFIEIPILANLKLKNVNLYAGPYIGILIAGSKKEALTTDIPILDVIDLNSLGLGGISSFFLPSSGTEVSNISGTDGLRKIDIGINAGIGYEINDIQLNLMYSQGILDYRSDKTDEPKETLNLFRISIGYQFDLKKKTQKSSVKFQ